MVKVSIIISAYNHEKFLKDTVSSLIKQTFSDFEIILIDNGSNDSTYKICKSFSDSRIKVFQIKKNIGFAYALNYAFEKCQGEYISLFTSDDISLPDKLKKQVKYLDDHPEIGAVFSKAQMIDEDGNNTKHNYNEVFDQVNRSRYEWLNYFFNKGNCLCFSSALIRKSVYKEIGLENMTMTQLHDFDLWKRLCLKYEIYIFQENLIKFRIRNDNKNASAPTIDNQFRSIFEFSHILKNYLKIKNISEYNKIFPNSIKKYKDIISSELIPYYVAREALNIPQFFYYKFALDVIYDLLNNEKAALKIRRFSNFDYADFSKLAGKFDIYNINQIHLVKELKEKIEKLNLENNELKKPLEQIKRFFKNIISS
jgi:glycosyltransferase involved in cell wall biosynthesis